ncbi:MAG: hypothetical protein SOW59_00565 [Corynebacterium sp.]|nr:hypothetical protein [Corynebacterium sp.]
MTEAAGIFHSRIELGDDSWRWMRSESSRFSATDRSRDIVVLREDSGDVIARVHSGVFSMGHQDLLLENTAGPQRFRLRATSPQGKLFTLSQIGFTVSHLRADCDGRIYYARRLNPFRRVRTIFSTAGNHVRTTPDLKGQLLVVAAPNAAPITFFDAAFITYGCFLLDGPGITRV